MKELLRIAPKKYGGETTVISMRLSKELVKEIDRVADLTGRNRNDILTKSLEFALNHMELSLEHQEENHEHDEM